MAKQLEIKCENIEYDELDSLPCTKVAINRVTYKYCNDYLGENLCEKHTLELEKRAKKFPHKYDNIKVVSIVNQFPK